MRLIPCLALAALVGACQPAAGTDETSTSEATAPPSGTPAEAPFQLQDAQGAQIAWVESRIGPARQVVGPERTYDIGACSVRMMAEGEDIVGYAVPLTAACSSLALPVLASYDLPQTLSLTFGQFAEARRNTTFKATCLHLCGNAADPVVYLESIGPNATPGIRAGAPLVDRDLIDAAFGLRDRMREGRDDDYVIDTRFNCDRQWDDDARATLAAFRVQEIEVGYRPIVRCG